MLCQSCGQRPATVKLKKLISGQTHELNLCYECYRERAFFDGAYSLFSSLFGQDPFFGGDQSFGRSYRERREVNVADFFSERARNVINDAVMFANEKGSRFVDTEHLLYGVASEEETGAKVLESLKIKTEDLKLFLEENTIDRGEEIDEEKVRSIDFTPRAKRAIELAFQSAREMKHNYVGPEHLLLGLMLEAEGLAAQTLQKYKVNAEEVKKKVKEFAGSEKPSKDSRAVSQPQIGGESAPAAASNTLTLDKYSRDLTQMARDGKLDPVIGRWDEVARVVQILSRRTKNNPVLIGEPGVGKTAVVEGLAQKIASGDVPDTIRGKRLVAIDIASMVAGTKYRGEFEKRLKKCLEEIQGANKQIMLFIDELHTIVGAGGAEGAIDASNILKPALARGELQAIGATTVSEYRKYIEKDAAFERRFQPILVDEPTVEDTIKILRGLRDKYEAHHKIHISDEAIVSAASLSDRYIKDRFLPDKAIDLIDEAASKVRIEAYDIPKEIRELENKIRELEKEKAAEKRNPKKIILINRRLETLFKNKEELDIGWRKDKATGQPTVFASDIEKLVATWTGIPVAELAKEEVEKLLNLEKKLHARVIGQEKAVAAVAEAIRRGRAGLKNPNRPIGSFLFLGPTGVGKTELAKALAQTLFGDENAMVRVDMSEYMESHSVAKMIGSPPGYVGHEEGGQLTEKVRKKPYSVILLDEIEKAHPDVFNMLLQILEDGRLTDSKGKTVDFKNTVIISTSNIGSDLILRTTENKELGFGGKAKNEKQTRDNLETDLMQELRNVFRPEFLNRLDETIIFEALSSAQIKAIVDLMIAGEQRLLRGQNITLKISPAARAELAKRGYDPAFGARPLRRLIQKEIENPLSTELLSGRFRSGDTATVDYQKGSFVFSRQTAKKKVAALVRVR